MSRELCESNQLLIAALTEISQRIMVLEKSVFPLDSLDEDLEAHIVNLGESLKSKELNEWAASYEG